MKFGIFDHLDRRDDPLDKFYDDRLAMASAADAAGFYSYHIAEHHATPLGLAPSPNLFLALIARETKRLRFGPLVYLLPLYHPVRLIEEICMLDQLSGGRLDLGVGRGVSPHEVSCYGVEPAKTRDMFLEALDVVLTGLTSDRLEYDGDWYHVPDMPQELRPVQTPYPDLWYGAGNEDGARFAAQRGMHMVTMGDNERVAGVVALYREMWEETRDDPARAGSPVDAPLAGIGRHVVIADTDAEAERLAAPAYAHWYDSLAKLWRDHGGAPVTGMIIDNYQDARRRGQALVGSPETVRAEVEAQIADIGFNYFVGQFAWGCLSHEQEMRSLRLFADEVMPAVAAR